MVIGQVSVTPSSAGMPAAGFVQQLLGWLAQIGLWGSVASMFLGAAVWGLSTRAGSMDGAYKGKSFAIAGVVGAFLVGIAPSAVNLVFRAAGQ